MRHETAPTAGNAISCDTKRLRRSEMPFHATRNGFDGRKCHFMRHDAAQQTISGHPKRAKRGSRPFLVTRNEQKEVCGHFGPPETTKKWIAAISGHQKRLKRGSQPFRVTGRGFDGASSSCRTMRRDAFRPRRASRSGGACRRTSSRRQRLRPAAFRRIGAGSRPACGAVGGHCRAS